MSAALATLVARADAAAQIEVLVQGEGPDVVLLPSAQRGAEDFAQLQADLAQAGFRSLAVNYRGAGASRGPMDLSFREVVADVAAVITSLCAGRVHLVGHALGNTVARASASFHPELVRSLTTMPCGGHNLSADPPSREVLEHFRRCHDLSLPREQRLESLQVVFFAPGNDPSAWLEGWHPATHAVSEAMQRSDPSEWWRGGEGPILIIQPLQDAMLPNEAARETAAQLGHRVTYVEVPRCGHAILPEQPEVIAEHLIRFLRANAG